MRKLGTILTLLALTVLTPGAAKSGSIQDFLNETQKIEQMGDNFIILWWVAPEILEISAKTDASITEKEAKELTAFLDDYIIIGVADVKSNLLGNLSSAAEETIRQNISIKGHKGTKIYPISKSELPNGINVFIGAMKGYIAGNLGQFGDSLYFVIFPGNDREGKRIFDPRKKGSLVVEYKSNTYIWRLPLGSLLPPKYDRETGEIFPGNYDYNPFTGERLITK